MYSEKGEGQRLPNANQTEADTPEIKTIPLMIHIDNESVIDKISSIERQHLVFPDRLFNFLID